MHVCGAYSYNPDDGEFYRINKRKHSSSWKVGGWVSNNGYKSISLNGKRTLAHRVVWKIYNGCYPPKGIDIDHINGNKLDNRIDNLRLATRSQNNWNAKVSSNNKLGIKGVCRLPSGNYRATLMSNYKQFHLGVFKTAQAAKQAVMSAREKLTGEFTKH